MKRSPLVRSTSLARVGMLRRKALAPGRVRMAVPPKVRRTLAERSGGLCEVRLPGCWQKATEAHHRISQKAGGRHGAAKERHDRLANVIHTCRLCHLWITTRPAQAYEHGLALREHQDPAKVPVLLLAYDDLPVYLDDAGRWHRFEAVTP